MNLEDSINSKFNISFIIFNDATQTNLKENMRYQSKSVVELILF